MNNCASCDVYRKLAVTELQKAAPDRDWRSAADELPSLQCCRRAAIYDYTHSRSVTEYS